MTARSDRAVIAPEHVTPVTRPYMRLLRSSEGSRLMRPDELDHRLRERLDAPGLAPRAELLHVLMLPNFDRADRIGSYWGDPQDRGSC
jgi:hypothetical protein